MVISLEDAKSISEITSPFVKPIIETILKPQLKKLGDWIQKKDIENKVIDNFWENKFTKYLESVYANSSYMTTLVFPNQQTHLEDLYVPLTIISSRDHDTFKIDKLDYSLFEKYGKLIISDAAGMGKSTLLKKISISIIEQNKSIPILIALRKIDNSNSIIDEIFNQIDLIDKSFDKELIYKFLELGFFTILLDGYDEIPVDLQENVTSQISDFIKKATSNKFVITSRPEPTLTTFVDFQLFHIQPLQEKEAFQLIEKLDDLSQIKLGKKLINEIQEKNQQVKEFLVNPFLVSLLFKSYTYNKDIPSKKSTFYEEVYSCLFKHHDLSKEGFKRSKRSKLDILDFEIILRNIGFETSKLGKVIYSKDELIKYIKTAKDVNPSIEFKEQNYMEDLTTTVPLFSYEGDKIKWAHKSIQDFFAAKFISNHARKEEIISRILAANKYQYLNILDLLYELESKLFRKVIIKSLLESFINLNNIQFKENSYIEHEMIEDRISLCFGSKYYFMRMDSDLEFFEARKILYDAMGSRNINLSFTTIYHKWKICIFREDSIQKYIIKMLLTKNEDLFKKPAIYVEPKMIDLSALQISTPYIIDYNFESPLNTKQNYGVINYFLTYMVQNEYFLDINKCKKQLELINKEIELDASQDLLCDI